MASDVAQIQEPSEKERKEIIETCKNADKIHKFINDKKGGSFEGKWIDDSERYLFFSYFEAKTLNRYSRTLAFWTTIIGIFTVVLGASTITDIIKLFLLK